MNDSFDENAKYIQKNLRLTLDEISKDTASKVDSQKYQATDVSILAPLVIPVKILTFYLISIKT